MGVVFDIYWNYGDAGDQYLGRVLTGLDPNSESFDVLPPYFPDPTDEDVVKALNICFPNLIIKRPEKISIFTLLLATLINNSDFVSEVLKSEPLHFFCKLSIFDNVELVCRLKNKISMDISNIMRPTGIPPHVSQLKILKEICDTNNKLMDRLEHVKDDVKEALENVQVEAGQLTLSTLKKCLGEEFDKLSDIQKRKADNKAYNNSIAPPGFQMKYDVPNDFNFPFKCNLFQAWKMWVKGMSFKNIHIKPFRLMKSLPKGIQSRYRTEWRPILTLIEEGINYSGKEYDISENASDVVLKECLEEGLNYVKNRASYILETDETRRSAWTVGTWSCKTKPSFILKNGSEQNKMLLLNETECFGKNNKQRKRKYIYAVN